MHVIPAGSNSDATVGSKVASRAWQLPRLFNLPFFLCSVADALLPFTGKDSTGEQQKSECMGYYFHFILILLTH
jgi:hypothetical protein